MEDKKLEVLQPYNNNKNRAFELRMTLRVKELDNCINAIKEAADKGKSDCFLKSSSGMICKENLLELTNEYGFDLNITIHSKIDTFIQCYFGDSCNGSITIEKCGPDITNVDVDDLYENMNNYVWNKDLIKSL